MHRERSRDRYHIEHNGVAGGAGPFGIGLSDPDLLMSIADTVDGWEKGI